MRSLIALTKPIWSDPVWGVLVLLVWSVASVWVLGVGDSHAAVAGHLAFAMAYAALIPIAILLPISSPALALGGLWTIASPWALGYASQSTAMWISDVLVGIVFTATALVLWRRFRASLPEAPSPAPGA